jgi:hypothetical protein
MAQHFLLSARARTLSVATIARLTDDEAQAMFVSIRFAENKGEPFCPRVRIVDDIWLSGATHLEMQRLRSPVLGYQRNDFRQPETSDPRLPDRHRDFRQCRKGDFRASTRP